MPPLILPEDDIDDAASVSSHTFSDLMLSNLPRMPKQTRNYQEFLDSDESESETDADKETIRERRSRPAKVLRRTLSHVQIAQPAYPRSAFEGWQPPLARSDEKTTISDLKAAHDKTYSNTDDPPEYTYLTLKDFSIYHPRGSRHAGELVTLDKLQKGSCTDFLFDGVLSFGHREHFLQGVKFSIMTVDGYGESKIASVRNHICIQSPQARTDDVWFRLGEPSAVYRRFHEPFLWLAQFTKLFVDYLLKTEKVTLHHFRREFGEWLRQKYSQSPDLQPWLEQCNHMIDFRTTVAAHVGYLWKECYSIDDPSAGLCKHPIWGEVNPFGLTAIEEQPNQVSKTIVTPFVYDCFKDMYFHQHMEVKQVSNPTILSVITKRKQALGLTPFGASQAPEVAFPTPQSLSHAGEGPVDVRIGDVICVLPETDGPWRLTCTTWFAYVQDIRHQSLQTLLDVVWLYEPHDTTFGNAHYPFKNELFMSDNCGCGQEAVNLDDVIGKADVTFFAEDPSQHSGLFVRQKFRTIRDEGNYDFVYLKKSDFSCSCAHRVSIFEDCRLKYQIGDTVLVKVWNQALRDTILEPSQIVDFDLNKKRLMLRRLPRKQTVDPNAAPNELMLSDEVFNKPPSAIVRRCNVQFFSLSEAVAGLPNPYNRRGTADCFYIITSKANVHNHLGLNEDDIQNGSNDGDGVDEDYPQANTEEHSGSNFPFPPLTPGLNLTNPDEMRKLNGMGIFCGGGNFDRGLEEGGAVKFKYAVDWAERAIHSYRTNVDDPAEVRFFLGSVNDYLARAMAGDSSHLIACPGDIGVLSGGSPCPGFSTMQLNKQSEQSLRNASMVASVVSFVDFYCPEYLVLENVTSMTHGMGPHKRENVFAQILAALVAMGYQTQQFLMEAWNYGSSESRSRVFIVASAPGLEPLAHPPHTHAHPKKHMYGKALGTSTNGLPFGVRRDDFTPFQHVSPAEATADLPNIDDSQPQLCPAFPDHRTPSEESADSRARMEAVPKHPYGMGIAQAALKGRLTGESLAWFERQTDIRKKAGSRSYSRVVPTGLFGTVTTTLNIQCGVSGSTLHWDQDRSLTVMELRRTQGYPDTDVIVGTPRYQVQIIGNSVERNTALVLGLSLRESWAQSKRLEPSSSIGEDSMGSAQSGFESLPWTPRSERDEQDRSTPQSIGGGLTLSQEERTEIQQDLTHGFSIINRIVSQRNEGVSLKNGAVKGPHGKISE